MVAMEILLIMVKSNSIDPHLYFSSNLMNQSNLELIYHRPSLISMFQTAFYFNFFSNFATSIHDDYERMVFNIQNETHNLTWSKTKHKNKRK